MAGRDAFNGSPPSARAPASRYAYLVGRLRNRQITMEEATELFGLMDETIRMLRTASLRPAAPAPSPRASGAASPASAAPPSGGRPAALGTDDLLTAGVLMIGAGAGIAAALRRRSTEGPKRPESPRASGEKGSSSGP